MELRLVSPLEPPEQFFNPRRHPKETRGENRKRHHEMDNRNMTDHARMKPQEHGKHMKLAALEQTPSSTHGDGFIVGVGVGVGNVLVLL